MIWIISIIWYIIGFIYSLKTDYRIKRRLNFEAIISAVVFGLIGPIVTLLYYTQYEEE